VVEFLPLPEQQSGPLNCPCGDNRIEDISVPTSLPPTHEPENRNLNGLGADAWAGIVVVLAMFIVGVIYWSGHTNSANATGAPVSQAAGSGAAPKTATRGSGSTVQ
jgi:hypothetical protein